MSSGHSEGLFRKLFINTSPNTHISFMGPLMWVYPKSVDRNYIKVFFCLMAPPWVYYGFQAKMLNTRGELEHQLATNWTESENKAELVPSRTNVEWLEDKGG